MGVWEGPDAEDGLVSEGPSCVCRAFECSVEKTAVDLCKVGSDDAPICPHDRRLGRHYC